MTTYSAPPAVTNLTATWNQYESSSGLESNVQLSWTAPTVTSGTLGSYEIYILLYNNVTQVVEEVIFQTLNRHALKTSKSSTAYSVAPPATSSQFPYSTWTVPSVYSYPSPDSYSFHVYAKIVEDPLLTSPVAGIDVFYPHLVGTNEIGHFNPRFQLDNLGTVQLLMQDSYEDISSSVEMILSTPQGWRTALPQFGIPDPTFQAPNQNVWLAAISRWEPRANVIIDIQPSFNGPNAPADEMTVNVKIIPPT